MEKAPRDIQTVINMMENGKEMKKMGTASWNMQTVMFIMDIGNTIKWMGMVLW